MAKYGYETIKSNNHPKYGYKSIEDNKVSPKESLQDFFKKMFREQAKSTLGNVTGQSIKKIPFAGQFLEEPASKAGYGAIPAVEQIPQGTKEGVLGALMALIGKEYKGEPISDEYGAEFGRGLGKMLGQGAIAAAPAGAASKGLTTLGLPKALSAILGTGLGFGATTQGDIIDRSLSGLEAAGIHGAGKVISSIAKGTLPLKEIGKQAKSALNIGKNFKEKNAALSNLSQKEILESDAIQNKLLHKEAYDELLENQRPIESQMKQNPLLASAEEDTLKRKSNLAQQQKSEINKNLSQEPELNTSMMPQKPIIEVQNLKNEIKAQENLLKENKQKAAEHEQSMKQHLGEGEEHGVPIAEHVVEHVKKVKKDIGKEYDAIEQDLQEKHVTIPRTESIEKIEEEYRKLLKGSKAQFVSDEELENLVKQAAKNAPKKTRVDIIPANEFLSNFRTMRQMAQKMKSSAYEKGISRDEQALRETKATEMMNLSDEMEHILEQQNMGDSLKQLKNTNKRWRTEITPLYENTNYKTFLNKGYASSEDLIKSLRGNKEGQVIIRNIIKESPEMTKRIVGMSHAKNPSELLSPRELTREYLNQPHMEETNKLINQYKDHLKNIEQNEKQLNELKETHEINKEKTSENKIEQERREKVSSLYDNMVKLDADVAQLEHAAETASHLAKQKKISLKEKMRLEKEAAKAKQEHAKAKKLYNEAENKYKKSVNDIKKLGIYGVGAVTGSLGLNKFKKMITD